MGNGLYFSSEKSLLDNHLEVMGKKSLDRPTLSKKKGEQEWTGICVQAGAFPAPPSRGLGQPLFRLC